MSKPRTIMLAAVGRGWDESCAIAVITATREDIEAGFRTVDDNADRGVSAIVFLSPSADWYGANDDEEPVREKALESAVAAFEESDEERLLIDPKLFEGLDSDRTDESTVTFSRTFVWWSCCPKHEDVAIDTVPLTREEALKMFAEQPNCPKCKSAARVRECSVDPDECLHCDGCGHAWNP